MTCASCAARIEKKLNKFDGVSATVNYALAKATASIWPGIDPQFAHRHSGEGRVHRRTA